MALKPWSEIEGSSHVSSYSQSKPDGGGIPKTEEASQLLRNVENGEKLSPEEAERARDKYLSGFRRDESNDRRDASVNNQGFGKVGEKGTDGFPEAEDGNADPFADEGFQILKPANPDEVKKRQEKLDYVTGGSDAPAQANITLGEVDHFSGGDFRSGDDINRNEELPEDLFNEVVSRKHLSRVSVEKGNERYNAVVKTDRIRNKRQRKWLEHNGGAGLVSELWKDAILVEVLIRSHGESAVVIHATGKDGKGSLRDIRLDLHDFFTMFAIPNVKGGDSCFEAIDFSLKNPNDIKKLQNFLENVTLEGRKIGSNNREDLPPTRIKPWKPREASKDEKETLGYISKLTNTDWKVGTPDDDIYASQSNRKSPKSTDVNARDIWKR